MDEKKQIRISFELEGDDAARFAEYQKRHNVYVNAVAARKALFDQIDIEEAKAPATVTS
jgi:hypothetical protein